MGRPGRVALLIALFVLLGTLHGTRAQYDDYEFHNYKEDDFADDEYLYEDEENAGDDEEGKPIDSSGEEGGRPPLAGPHNKQFTPMCNNENC